MALKDTVHLASRSSPDGGGSRTMLYCRTFYDDGRCSLCCPVGYWALEMWLVWMLNFVSFKKNLKFKQLVWLLATILESANLECLTFSQPDLQTGVSGSWYGNQKLSRQSRLWNIWSPHPTPPCAHRSWKGWSLSLCSVVSNLYSLS